MKKIDLTIVCCYNNEKQLKEQLIDSLKKQDVECETILVDNTENKFSSASKALNFGASKVKTKYVLFSHQDVVFEKTNELENIYNYMVKYSDSIIGVAGVKIDSNDNNVYTNIHHGPNKLDAGHIKISEPEKVISVDECLFGMNMEIYNMLKFDEINFDNWHLYAVDLCYNANRNNINVYVIPSNIWHTSSGKLNHNFFVGVKRMKNKYKNDFDYIKSTCITLKCSENVRFKEFKILKISKMKIYKFYLKLKNKQV